MLDTILFSDAMSMRVYGGPCFHLRQYFDSRQLVGLGCVSHYPILDLSLPASKCIVSRLLRRALSTLYAAAAVLLLKAFRRSTRIPLQQWLRLGSGSRTSFAYAFRAT